MLMATTVTQVKMLFLQSHSLQKKLFAVNVTIPIPYLYPTPKTFHSEREATTNMYATLCKKRCLKLSITKLTLDFFICRLFFSTRKEVCTGTGH